MRVKVLLVPVTLFVLIFGYSLAHAQANVWDVLRSQFKLNHQVSQPEVQKQIRWLSSRPHYVVKLAKQSEPYIYHIVSELKKNRLPGELALLPMIESAYDPFAYSGAGAAGLWQLMPGTGSGLGLQQDWWFDGRRSIRLSTAAALKYLTYLNKFFNGNWILALAAYDSGEGTIKRAIKNSAQDRAKANFWNLKLPRETKAYIPRLLALAEIIKYPGYYKVNLPDIRYEPYFLEVEVGSQIELNKAAKLAQMPYRDLIKLNPGHNRWTTPPEGPHKLLLPADKVELFKKNLENTPKNNLVCWKKHQVKSGESLVQIAKQHHTTLSLLKELNQLTSTKLTAGQFLLIPQIQAEEQIDKKAKVISLYDRSSPGPHRKMVHIVQAGDTVKSLEERYQLQPGQIRYWNQISGHKLQPGDPLVIWKKGVESTPMHYTIKKGDSLSRIAQRFNTSMTRLKQANPQLKKDILRIGQRIKIS
ncbi:MAG: LysM peptidoglycan-binding domain-containing protein [Legionellaceae bacterium]|nr:LysM peptidoglycan-binding domain-containing protein [Legionellaceae bacterium]